MQVRATHYVPDGAQSWSLQVNRIPQTAVEHISKVKSLGLKQNYVLQVQTFV